jgi:alcohol dehydrogenase, propanol-preferring
MRVAVVQKFGDPLVLENRSTPIPGPGQVVVRLEASGLCHTDIHASHGDWPVKPTLPFVPGHEGVGIVESVGPDVDLAVGTRVAVPWLHTACGSCEQCVSGWETLCLDQKNTGYGVDGCYGDHVLADGSFVVPVPDGVDPFDAAPLTCAGVTTYKAVKVSGTRPTNILAVFGVGGLGHMAIQYARIAGAEVVAVDVDDTKLEMARKLGASYVVNAKTHDPVAFIQELGGAHQAIVTAASPEPCRQAYDSLRRNGTLVLVGLPAENHFDLPIFQTVLNGITVKGSIVGTRQDLREVFDLHARGLTSVTREVRPLETVNASIADVLSGNIEARIVFDPTLSPV